MTSPTPSPRRLFDERFAVVLMLTDLASCTASVLSAFALRTLVLAPVLSPFRHEFGMYLQALPVVAGLWLITFYSAGLYDVRRFPSSLAEMTATFRAVTVTALLVAGASFLSHLDYSRAIVVLFWGSALIISLLSRWVLRSHMVSLQRRGAATARALVLGCGDLAQVVAQRISAHHLLGYELVGLVSVGNGKAGAAPEGLDVLGDVSELPELVVKYHIDEVLVAQPDISPGILMTAIQACEDKLIEFHIVAGPLQVLTENAEISGLGEMPVVALPPQRFLPWQRAFKRLLDSVCSVLLLILLAPLMLVLAWLVRRETGAAALFRQERIGYRGKAFTMFKFRTMSPSTPAYAEAPKAADDQRITPLGQWLRRTSLDELPQLFNVLRGEMSLVGPRPEMAFIVAQYEPWQRRRLDAKPGITGLWQILGRKDLPLRDNLEYDFYYLRNWSIWLDLTILLRTIPVVIHGRGAY
ncbi:sugar transferase [bacterium]|nr:sugar transferase [bacterium]